MIKEAIGTGRTVEEAIEAARTALGPYEADVELEVLDLPKKSFFGLKQNPARVRAYVELPDPKPEKTAPAPKKERPSEVKKETKPQPPKAPKPEKAAPAVADNRRAEPARATEPARAADPARATDSARAADPAREIEPVDPQKIEKAHQYLLSVFEAMNLTALTVTPGESEGAIVIRVEGEESAAVIGRRGETLDALQYLTSLAANRGEGTYARVIIDTGNYRERRQETLESLAKRLAERVVRSGRSHTLEPMNAYERRIIHSAVSQVKGATSASTGEEPNRRVVIASKRHGGGQSGGGNRSQSGGSGSGRSGRPSGGKGRDDRRSGGGARRSEPRDNSRREKPEPNKEPTNRGEAPKEALDKPLYGKIEL